MKNKFDLIIQKVQNQHMFRNEYAYYKFLAKKYLIDDNTYRAHEVCNIIFNALIVIALFILFILSKITFTFLLFALPITFIAYDIFGIALNRIIGCIHLKSIQISSRKDIQKFSQLSKDEQEKYISDLRDKKYNVDDDNIGSYTHLQAQIETCREVMENYKTVDDKLEEILVSKNLSDIERAKESIKQLEEHADFCPKQLMSQYDSIISKSKDLLKIATEKPNSMDKLNKTYSIYFKELINLLESYNDLTSEERKEKKVVLKTIMLHFLEHLDDLETCLSAETKMSFDISSSVLIDNLKKEKHNVQE